MEPMFLRDVEAAETNSPFSDLIRHAKRDGAEFPQIWHMFAFQPHATKHLERFTQAIMREPGPINRACGNSLPPTPRRATIAPFD